MNDLSFIEDVLKTVESVDGHSDLHWTFDENGKIWFTLDCSDVFSWGCSDFEELTPENIHIFKKAIEDIKEIKSANHHCVILFAVRSRKGVPQQPFLDLYKKEPAYLELLTEFL